MVFLFSFFSIPFPEKKKKRQDVKGSEDAKNIPPQIPSNIQVFTRYHGHESDSDLGPFISLPGNPGKSEPRGPKLAGHWGPGMLAPCLPVLLSYLTVYPNLPVSFCQGH